MGDSFKDLIAWQRIFKGREQGLGIRKDDACSRQFPVEKDGNGRLVQGFDCLAANF
jgi:hypothetical protein